MKNIYLLLLLCFGFAVTSQAANPADAHRATAARLRQGLAKARTPQDSIRILYDVFDVSERQFQPDVAREIYAIADRIGDTPTRLDICRLITACFKDDATFVKILDNVKKLPDIPERRETELFIEMRRLAYSSKYLPEDERQQRLAEIIARYEKGGATGGDKYQRALDLYTVVEYLRNVAGGDMLEKYLDQLTKMVEKDFQLYAIHNIVYSEAANIYSDAGDYKKAAAADRKLLDVIDRLEKDYRAKGRNYRDFDISRYVSYRRLIRNYPALTVAQVNDYYGRICKLAETSPEVAHDYVNNPRLNAYYYVAIGRNAEAIPYIRELLDKEKALIVRKQLLEMLRDAAQAVGDNDTRMWALTEHNAILEQLNTLQAADKYKELQILYDVKTLQERNSALELENRNKEIESERRIMSFVLAAFAIIFVVLVLLLFYWSRFHSNTRRMGNIVNNLARERNRLRNTCYHDYGDALDPLAEKDQAEDWKQIMKETHHKQSNVTTFLTESILNDLVHISSIGRPDRQKDVQRVSLDKLLREVEGETRRNSEPDFRLDIEYPENDLTLITDRECLVYMIRRIITTAEHLSHRKEVTLSTYLNNGSHTLSFIFTDNGSHRPEESERHIFSNFIDSQRLLSNKEWGLFFCRLVSFLLNCDLRYDRTYEKGTRFIFTVPINFAENLK